MKRTRNYETDSEREPLDYYMPGTPRLTTGDSRVERLVKSLFRRRGGLRPAWTRG
jgi:hypothetical protein